MAGRLIYLMGPSGSGKDSLLQAARARLEAIGCRIVRRVITRSAEAAGEEAVAVSQDEFERLALEGAFAMAWCANGLSYGIPVQVDGWLAAGDDVLVNGSRGYLPEALRRYPALLAVLLRVSPQVLRGRLQARGRETPDEIEARLLRNDGFGLAVSVNAVELDNSAELSTTVESLLALIESSRLRFPS